LFEGGSIGGDGARSGVLAAAKFWQFASRLPSYPWVGNLETWPSLALRRPMAAYEISFDTQQATLAGH
jgi:hypothetical protein